MTRLHLTLSTSVLSTCHVLGFWVYLSKVPEGPSQGWDSLALRLPAHSQGTYVPGPEHISLNNPQCPTWPGRTRARPQPWHRVLCHRHPAGSTAMRTAPLARPCARPWEGCQVAIRPASVIS